jgi:threonine/homoserine/homoserine lactone efflux protein
MFETLLSGIATGLLIAILPGPVFFSLLKTSLNQGFRNGLFVAIGIALSDILYIIVTQKGLSALMGEAYVTALMGYAGGGLLIIVGISAFVLKVSDQTRDLGRGKGYFRSFSRGFLINLINPFVLLFWISTVSLVSLGDGYTDAERFSYFTTAVATIFLSDLLKAYTAMRLSRWITPKMLMYINKVSGVALIVFGLRLIYFAFSGN